MLFLKLPILHLSRITQVQVKRKITREMSTILYEEILKVTLRIFKWYDFKRYIFRLKVVFDLLKRLLFFLASSIEDISEMENDHCLGLFP